VKLRAPKVMVWPLSAAVLVAPTVGWTWSGYNGVTISWATAYQSGKASPPGVEISITSAPADSEGCAYSGKGYAWIDFSSSGSPDGSTLYATVLAAEAAGKIVDIGLNGCASNGVPMVYAITMHP
jgi:hypothetical protein